MSQKFLSELMNDSNLDLSKEEIFSIMIDNGFPIDEINQTWQSQTNPATAPFIDSIKPVATQDANQNQKYNNVDIYKFREAFRDQNGTYNYDEMKMVLRNDNCSEEFIDNYFKQLKIDNSSDISTVLIPTNSSQFGVIDMTILQNEFPSITFLRWSEFDETTSVKVNSKSTAMTDFVLATRRADHIHYPIILHQRSSNYIQDDINKLVEEIQICHTFPTVTSNVKISIPFGIVLPDDNVATAAAIMMNTVDLVSWSKCLRTQMNGVNYPHPFTMRTRFLWLSILIQGLITLESYQTIIVDSLSTESIFVSSDGLNAQSDVIFHLSHYRVVLSDTNLQAKCPIIDNHSLLLLLIDVLILSSKATSSLIYDQSSFSEQLNAIFHLFYHITNSDVDKTKYLNANLADWYTIIQECYKKICENQNMIFHYDIYFHFDLTMPKSQQYVLKSVCNRLRQYGYIVCFQSKFDIESLSKSQLIMAILTHSYEKSDAIMNQLNLIQSLPVPLPIVSLALDADIVISQLPLKLEFKSYFDVSDICTGPDTDYDAMESNLLRLLFKLEDVIKLFHRVGCQPSNVQASSVIPRDLHHDVNEM